MGGTGGLKEGGEMVMVFAFSVGVGFLLVPRSDLGHARVLALALLARGEELKVGGVLAGVVAGTLMATPVISRGYALGEMVGLPFLGALGAATVVVLSAYAVGRVVGIARVAVAALRGK